MIAYSEALKISNYNLFSKLLGLPGLKNDNSQGVGTAVIFILISFVFIKVEPYTCKVEEDFNPFLRLEE